MVIYDWPFVSMQFYVFIPNSLIIYLIFNQQIHEKIPKYILMVTYNWPFVLIQFYIFRPKQLDYLSYFYQHIHEKNNREYLIRLEMYL